MENNICWFYWSRTLNIYVTLNIYYAQMNGESYLSLDIINDTIVSRQLNSSSVKCIPIETTQIKESME